MLVSWLVSESVSYLVFSMGRLQPTTYPSAPMGCLRPTRFSRSANHRHHPDVDAEAPRSGPGPGRMWMVMSGSDDDEGDGGGGDDGDDDEDSDVVDACSVGYPDRG